MESRKIGRWSKYSGQESEEYFGGEEILTRDDDNGNVSEINGR